MARDSVILFNKTRSSRYDGSFLFDYHLEEPQEEKRHPVKVYMTALETDQGKQAGGEKPRYAEIRDL